MYIYSEALTKFLMSNLNILAYFDIKYPKIELFNDAST